MAPQQDKIRLLPIGEVDDNDGQEDWYLDSNNLFKTDKKRNRVVYRNWPRDPNGAVLSTTSGKSADGGLTIWGATLADFFYTQVAPKSPEFWTISTSSKLLQFSQKTKGEKRHAALQIADARREENPVEILPFPMDKIIRDHDSNIMRRSEAGKAPVHKFHHPVPLHLLPEILHVYDPDTTLTATGCKSTSTQTKPRKYRLHLVSPNPNVLRRKRAELSESTKRRHGLLLVPESPVDQPAVFVEYPPRPADPAHTSEATLHLSAASKLGTGHHSFVYNAEWEVPRSWFVQPSVCEDCAFETLLKTLRRTNPDVEVDGSLNLEQQIAVLLKFPTSENSGDNCPFESIEIHDFEAEHKKHHSGPITVIPIDVAWSAHGHFYQCAHLPPYTDICASRKAKGGPVAISQPTTFKVTVAAKLSIQNDDQLQLEAVNYQKFPEHFFQHWSGYNLVPPLQDPTPCGPIAPQFYGYYLPVREAGEKYKYLSPILLVENCGQQIEVETMSYDDRLECASLLERMHLSEWAHNSIYPRNIVMDYGDLSEDPALHASSRKRRFRVIDFGRSTNNPRTIESDIEWCRPKIWEVCCIPSSYHRLSASWRNPPKVAKVRKVDLDIPTIYPVFDLYPAVYPFVKLYPIIPEDVRIRNAILAARAAAAAIAAAEKAETVKTMYSDFLISQCTYPVLVIYPSVYPHIELYDTIPQDVLERRARLAAQAAAAALAAAEKAATIEAMYSDFLVSRCTYPVLVVYPSAYPHVDPYSVYPQDIVAQREKLASQIAAKAAAAAEMAATIRGMYSDFRVSRCIYPVLVVYPSAYPHVDPYNVYPRDIIDSKAALAAEAARKLVAAREKASILETMASGFQISRCHYPVLVIYPPVYPHVVPYPRLPQDLLPPIISHEENVPNQGTLAKLDVVFTAGTALAVGYPHFNLYPPTHRQTPPSPVETEAGSPELEMYAGTTLVGSPSSDKSPLIPTSLSTPVASQWSPSESWSSIIYPHFDFYPAISTSPTSNGNSLSSDEFDSSFESSSGYDTGDLDDDDSDSGSATPKFSSARACVTHVAKVVGLTLMKSELRI